MKSKIEDNTGILKNEYCDILTTEDCFFLENSTDIAKTMRTEIKDLPNLYQALKAMLGSEELVIRWWDSPNLAFDRQTPQQVFEQDSYAVIRYVLNYIQK
jgi:hypothetical protein